MLTATLARPVSTELDKPNEYVPMAAFDVAEPIAAVATVYCEPAKDVTFPAPLVARVIALPPSEVTTVANDPPMEVTVWKTLPTSPVAWLKAEPATDVIDEATEPTSDVIEFTMLPRFCRFSISTWAA